MLFFVQKKTTQYGIWVHVMNGTLTTTLSTFQIIGSPPFQSISFLWSIAPLEALHICPLLSLCLEMLSPLALSNPVSRYALFSTRRQACLIFLVMRNEASPNPSTPVFFLVRPLHLREMYIYALIKPLKSQQSQQKPPQFGESASTHETGLYQHDYQQLSPFKSTTKSLTPYSLL